MSGPDVIVTWLQHDYGQLGRPSEAIAHALSRSDAAGRVAYVEPFHPGTGEAELGARDDRGLLVFTGRGPAPCGDHEVARGVISLAEMSDPILLNFGVAQPNWWFHYEFAPLCSRSVLVTYDKLAEWSAVGPMRGQLERTRRQLIAASDVVCGLSEGSIDDVPGGVYVGHGVDEGAAMPVVGHVARERGDLGDRAQFARRALEVAGAAGVDHERPAALGQRAGESEAEASG